MVFKERGNGPVERVTINGALREMWEKGFRGGKLTNQMDPLVATSCREQ